MKKIVCALLLVTSTYKYDAFADAFPKSSKALGGPVLSMELIGSYEIGLKEHGGLLFWGGYATIFSPVGLEFYSGPEAALEIRHYYTPKENKVWSLSFYSGVAYNIIGEHYGAVTPGIKITRKKSISTLIQSEPYLSLSYPFYLNGEHPVLPYLTFGYRFVFEIKKN